MQNCLKKLYNILLVHSSPYQIKPERCCRCPRHAAEDGRPDEGEVAAAERPHWSCPGDGPLPTNILDTVTGTARTASRRFPLAPGGGGSSTYLVRYQLIFAAASSYRSRECFSCVAVSAEDDLSWRGRAKVGQVPARCRLAVLLSQSAAHRPALGDEPTSPFLQRLATRATSASRQWLSQPKMEECRGAACACCSKHHIWRTQPALAA